MQHKPAQRIALGILLACFAFVFVVSTVVTPRVVQAQVTTIGSYPFLEQHIAGKEVKLSVGNTILSSAIVGLMNAIALAGQRLAYDAAVGLSTGCRGEQACAFTKAPKAYFADVGFDMAGEFIGNLAGPWEELGFDLCSPRIPQIGISIALGIAERFQPKPPKCDFRDVVNNWQAFIAETQDPQAVLSKLSLSFEPGQSDIGQAFIAQESFRIQYEKRMKAEETERKEGGGILSNKYITGEGIKTPAAVMKANFEGLSDKGKESQITAGDVAGATLMNGDVWGAVGQTMLATFTNTLLSRMLKLALQGIFQLGAGDNGRPDLMAPFGGEFGDARGGSGGGVGPSSAVSELLAPQPRTSSGAFDFLSKLGACPASDPFTCVIDRQFMVGIQRASIGQPITVKEAVDLRYLDSAKPFGYVNPSNNPPIEPQNPEEGYAYSAMKKLRLFRIIPLGWEMAAAKILQLRVPRTLGDVIDGWDKKGPDGKCGTSDPGESPFCGLVDPNWVLKAPVAKCGATVFGSGLDASKQGRQEVCADVSHCISQDDLGNCAAWGYCTRERNIWRIDADTCDAQYASCDNFKPQPGGGSTATSSGKISLLENTLDFGGCNAENAGCTAYRTSQNTANSTWFAAPLLYLDRDAPACKADQDGCTEFIASGSANLIKNSGFERASAADATRPDGWMNIPSTPGAWISDGSQAFEGQGALHPVFYNDPVFQMVPVEGRKTYTLSFYAKGGTAATIEAGVREGNSTELDITDEATTCELSSGTPRISFTPADVAGNATTYIRKSCSITMPENATVVRIEITAGTPVPPGTPVPLHDVWVDGIQFETGDTVTEYREGYSADITRAYYRTPPEYLNCTGEENDLPGCNNYARFCRPEEVGCERYTPQGGGTSIPALATIVDQCPAECVGYNTYLKQASTFEPKLAGENLYLIIPSRSTSCNASEAGCDEFTNLQTEQREYFSELRACQKPAADSQTYFTYEGFAGTGGYILREWSLKRSNAARVATDTYNGTNNNSDPATPPCTNYKLSIDATSREMVVTCKDKSPVDGATDQATCKPNDPTLTVGERADCRAFYDERGNIFYRRMSRTIVSTDECRAYRWTGFPTLPEVTSTPAALRTDLESEACTAGHGYWEPATNQCLYVGVPAQSRSCEPRASGCRGYKGNAGSNVEVVMEENFEGTVAGGWLGQSAISAISSEALTVGGHSRRVADAGGSSSGAGTAYNLTVSGASAPRIRRGETYFISFIAKGTVGSALQVQLRNGTSATAIRGTEAFPGTAVLSPDWKMYTLGPLTIQREINTAYLELFFRNAATSGSEITFFIDDVLLKRASDTVYLVKNSWDIPGSCDRLPEELGGGYVRGAMVGCQNYNDRANVTHPIKSFTSLCRDKDENDRERAVGCQDLIDTRGSDSPFEQEYNKTNTGVCRTDPRALTKRTDTIEGECYLNVGSTAMKVCNVAVGQTTCSYGTNVTACGGTTTRGCSYESNLEIDDLAVPADEHRYVVVDQEFACPATQKGCRTLGKDATTGTPIKNDPNEYLKTLCKFEEQGCSVWQRDDRSLSYFKDPGVAGCQWRTNVIIGNGTYSGWFRTASQPVSDDGGLVVDKDKCEGYGQWQYSGATRSCVLQPPPGSPAGTLATTVALPDPYDGCSTCDDRSTPTCAQCADLCNRGAGGIWDATLGQCASDAPCRGNVKVEGTLPAPKIAVDIVNTYLIGGTTFGLARNFDSNYEGRAAACPQEQATCTEFLDPTDTTASSRGMSYYRKDNARLAASRAACKSGEVSRKEGCVLFDKTDDPVRRWDAVQSYLNSDAAGGNPVPPVAFVTLATGNNDQKPTNTILKVTRDRECAEWFNCAAAQWVWQGDQLKTICTMLGRCDTLNPTTATPTGSLLQCAGWNNKPSLERAPNVSRQSCEEAGFTWVQDNPLTSVDETHCAISTADCQRIGGVVSGDNCQLGRLTEETYRLRDRRYEGQEYTGYSIPGLYAIDQLKQTNAGTPAAPNYVLAHALVPLEACTVDGDCDDGQKCAQRQCVTTPTGQAFNATSTDDRQCRGYPEYASPFGNTELIRGNNQEFGNVGRCIQYNSSNCDCSYTKAEFSGDKRYYNTNAPNVPAALCVGVNIPEDARRGFLGLAPLRGSPKTCVLDGDNPTLNTNFQISRSECIKNNGQCLNQTKKTQVVGWKGYCLDYDPSRSVNSDPAQHPCITWLPVDQITGEADIYNQFAQAGYQLPAQGGRYYCLFGKGATEKELIDNPIVFINANEAAGGTVGVGETSGSFIRVYTFPVEQDIYRYDIKEIEIANRGSEDFGPSSGTNRFQVGEVHGDTPVDAAHHTPLGRAFNITGFHAYDFGIPPSATTPEWWWWGGDDNFNADAVGTTARPLSQDPNAISATIMSPQHFLDTSGPHALTFDNWQADCDAWLEAGGTGDSDTEESYDGVYVGFHFDPVSQKLEHVRLGECNAGGGSIATSFPSIKIRTHAECSTIAEIDTVGSAAINSAPYTNRLWSGGDYRIAHTTTARYCQGGTEDGQLCQGSVCLERLCDRSSNRDNYGECLRCGVTTGSGCFPYTARYQIGTCVPRGLDYTYSFGGENSPAFGSSPEAQAQPTSAVHPWFLNHNLLEDSDAQDPGLKTPFAGWPYGCENTGGNPYKQCSVRVVGAQAEAAIPIDATSGAPVGSGPITLEGARDNFARLFAKSHAVYDLGASATYAPATTVDGTTVTWDYRAAGRPPRVRAGGAGFGGLQEMDEGSGPSVNGVFGSGTVVTGTDGSLLASLKFFAWADKNQMPIRKMFVDWGDGTGVFGEGLYQNRRGKNGAGISNCSSSAEGFGGLEGTTCRTEPYQYDYMYSCDRGSAGWKIGNACPVDEFRSRYGGCCVFRPAVQVTDNWGWCSGDRATFGSACEVTYNPDFTGSAQTAWVVFKGKIAIAPRIEE